MDHEWRLEPQPLSVKVLRYCWRDCGRLAVWDLTWYGCSNPHCGKPVHPRHRSAHEHYCHQHAIERGAEGRHGPRFDDAHIRRVRQHPWKLDEEVAA